MTATGRTLPVCLRTGHVLYKGFSDQPIILYLAVFSYRSDERRYPVANLQLVPTRGTSRVSIVVLSNLWQIKLKAVGQLYKGADCFERNRLMKP
jgi:hypothetical protein